MPWGRRGSQISCRHRNLIIKLQLFLSFIQVPNNRQAFELKPTWHPCSIHPYEMSTCSKETNNPQCKMSPYRSLTRKKFGGNRLVRIELLGIHSTFMATLHWGLSPVLVVHYFEDRIALTNQKVNRNVCIKLDIVEQHQIIRFSLL